MEAMSDILQYADLKLGLYEYDKDDNQKSVVAYKVIDASALCPKSKRCVIKYADVHAGRIAQIHDWYKPNKDLGTVVHYHINFATPIQLAKDSVFKRMALTMGSDPLELAEYIYNNQ